MCASEAEQQRRSSSSAVAQQRSSSSRRPGQQPHHARARGLAAASRGGAGGHQKRSGREALRHKLSSGPQKFVLHRCRPTPKTYSAVVWYIQSLGDAKVYTAPLRADLAVVVVHTFTAPRNSSSDFARVPCERLLSIGFSNPRKGWTHLERLATGR